MLKRITLTLSIILLLTGCGNNNKENKNTVKNKNENEVAQVKKNNNDTLLAQLKTKRADMKKDYDSKEQITSSPFFTVTVNSFEDVENLTELGIEGVVTSSEPCPQKVDDTLSSPYTKLTVLVTQVLKGNKDLVNKEITVYQSGGLISKREMGFLAKRTPEAPTLTEEQLDEQVVVNSNNVSISFPGDEVVFYLVKVDGAQFNTDETVYMIMADYLTRFDKNEETNTYERPDTKILDKSEVSITAEELKKLNEDINKVVAK